MKNCNAWQYHRFVALLILPLLLLSSLLYSGTLHEENRVPLAASQPAFELDGSISQPIAVILQANGQSQTAIDVVQQVGGVITKELPIINALAAEVPAAMLGSLQNSPHVRWVVPDAPIQSSATQHKDNGRDDIIKETPIANEANTYLDTLGVRDVWKMGLRGEGVGVAVIDSGIQPDADFDSLVKRVTWGNGKRDTYGHGTHVAGIIASNGRDSNGRYMGIAPEVDLISLKVGSEKMIASESDVVAAMQWILKKRDRYNIRVVNLSVNSTVAQSYHASPMNAAAEVLWFNGIVVVTSAGNMNTRSGEPTTISAAPANDPFLITVGASDELSSTDRADDIMAHYSAYGVTRDGFQKPDIVAPGTKIISTLSRRSKWLSEHPDRVVNKGQHFYLSGTSMAAPMVTGAIALLLQAEPELTPDQVKHRLLAASGTIADNKDRTTLYPYLNIAQMIQTSSRESANQGLAINQLLSSDTEPKFWDSVGNAVNWNGVNWNAVNWNAVNWNVVNWNSVYWDDSTPFLQAASLPTEATGETINQQSHEASNTEPLDKSIFLPLVMTE